MGVSAFYFISCTSSKENISTTSTQDYYKDNSYAQPYINNPQLISGDSAIVYINHFKKHIYRGWRKNKLLNAWSTFDRTTLDSLVNDRNTDSVYFFLAAYLKNDKDKDQRKHPFVIMEAIPKPSSKANGKGSTVPETTLSKSLFFMPVKMCPPPNTGCAFPGN